jgi:predicted Zn-dependent protease
MKPMRRFVAPLLLTVAGLVLGCATTGVNKGDVNLVSLQEEWDLGNQLSADIAKQSKIVADPSVKAYITAMGEKILAAARDESDVAQLPWTFDVIDDPQVNAFNIPGGHVYFYSGLIAQAKSYPEVMGVMAHEVSHGIARHGTENMTKQYGIALVAGLVLGKNPATYQQILAQVLANGAIMKFSRAAEREADDLGVHFVYKAGVDPQGMVDFFQVLMSLQQSKPNAIEQFFASHPLTEDRIKDVSGRIAKLPAKTLQETDPGFDAFKARVAQVSTKS